jgi:hypothetical protein
MPPNDLIQERTFAGTQSMTISVLMVISVVRGTATALTDPSLQGGRAAG